MTSDDEFKSILLDQLEFTGTPSEQMVKLYQRVNTENVNLGKLDVSKLTNKQLNCLLSTNRAFGIYDCRVFFNADMELILTTDYRYQKDHQDTAYRVGWMTLMIDYVFDKQVVNDD